MEIGGLYPHCFRKAGILDKDFNVVQEFVLESDPFDELDSEVDPELLDLMQQTSGNEHCSPNCYTTDDNVATCYEMVDENWEDDFFAGLDQIYKMIVMMKVAMTFWKTPHHHH